MASTPVPSTSPEEAAFEDDDVAELPMTIAASVVLEQLPRDAHRALETAGEITQEKGKLSGLMIPASSITSRAGRTRET